MWYFTLEEAEALIPKLEGILSHIADLQTRYREKTQNLSHLEKTETTDSITFAIAQSQTEFLQSQIKEILQEIAEMGAVPRSVDPCVVDFPAQIEGKDAYLCWKLGEKFISYYHSPKEGFQSRKLLPIKLKGSELHITQDEI